MTTVTTPGETLHGGNRRHFSVAPLMGVLLLPLAAKAAEPTLTTYYWASNDTTLVSGAFNDKDNWLDSSCQPAAQVPGALSLASFYHLPKAEYTVTLPEGVYTNYASIQIYGRQGKAVTIDGRGSVFVSPTTATDNYSAGRVRFYTSSKKSDDDKMSKFYIDDGGTGDFTSGYCLSNVVWRFKSRWNNNASIETVEFRQGLFNFYDYDGVPHLFRLYTYSTNPGSTNPLVPGREQPISLIFESGSSLRIYDFYPLWQYSGGRTLVNFNGGDHHIFGALNLFRNKVSNATESLPSEADVHIGGDAVVNANILRICHGTATQQYGPNQHTLVAVENGGTLVATGGVQWATFNAQYLYVTNGGYCAFGPTDGSAARPVNNFANASFSSGSLRGAPGTNIVAALVDNSRFDMTGTNRIGNVDLVLRDSTFNLIGQASVGYDSGRSARIAATNSTVAVNIDGGGTLYIGTSGTGVVELVDSDLTLAAKETVHLGENTGSLGEFILDGGSFASGRSVQNGNQVMVGYKGSGMLTVKNGTFEAHSMYVHYENSGTSNPTCIVHQTGGTIKITAGSFANTENTWYSCRFGQNSKAGVTKMVLDGGEFHAARLYATYSALNSPSTGCHTYFEADGGTIVGLTPSGSAENVITLRNFEKASLGSKGLTIRTTGETRTEQDFCDKEGSEGVGLLLLDGPGVKKLYGTNSTESLLVCVGGLTQFLPMPATGDNACHLSHLIVTNNASFSIAGDQNGAHFAAVTLADAASGATFAMDSADRVTVDGAMVVGGALTLSLADAAPVGTHPLFTAAGDASTATKANWAAARIVGADHLGLVYALSADYDSATDKTSFNLVVTAGGPLTGETVWQDDSSWDGSKLVKFTDASPAAVAVNSSAAAGAVRFDANKNFTLSGTGPLSFSDRGGYAVMETVRGVQTVETPIEVPRDMRITVASGATNVVSGVITGGGIVKDGRGTVRLTNGNNSLPNGVTVEEGLLSVPVADALGDVPITLSGGTLEITSAGQLQSGVEIATDDAATAAVVKVEADVTMPALDATQGAFIKRGVGRLTLTSDKDVFVCGPQSGPLANKNDDRPRSTTTFDGEGNYSISGQYAFGGFNVAEGELVLRGTADDVTFFAPAYTCVGIGTSQGSANPGLVVDHATFWCSGNRFNFGSTYDSSFAAAPYIIVTNKATLFGSFNCGSYASTANLTARMLVDDSVQYSFYKFYPMRGDKSADYLYRNGSALYVGDDNETKVKSTYCLEFNNGPATMTFSNSVLARKIGFAAEVIMPVAVFNSKNGVKHGVYMRDGSTLYSNWVSNYYSSASALLTIAFENSEWKPIRSDETGDFAFDFPPYESVRFEMEGRGVILSPAKERTFAVVSPFVGEGGMRKRGAGTLAFSCKDGMKSWGFAGALSIEEGAVTAAPGSIEDNAVVSLAAGTCLDLLGGTANGLCVSGAGTVANGTLASSVVKLDVPDDPSETVVPTIEADVVLAGRLTIDVGRTAERPLRIREVVPVAVWSSNSVPSNLDVRVVNSGSSANRGSLFVDGGVLYCRLTRKGFSLSIK